MENPHIYYIYPQQGNFNICLIFLRLKKGFATISTRSITKQTILPTWWNKPAQPRCVSTSLTLCLAVDTSLTIETSNETSELEPPTAAGMACFVDGLTNKGVCSKDIQRHVAVLDDRNSQLAFSSLSPPESWKQVVCYPWWNFLAPTRSV